jgi:aspartyl protease family protein
VNELPGTFKVITVWLLLGLILFLGFQYWERHQRQTQFVADNGVIEIRRAPDGHYHWPGQINGKAVDFLIDTGATYTALPMDLARVLNLNVLGTVQSSTAGGLVTGEVVRADVSLQGGVAVQRLPMVALSGLSDHPLLGMDVLSKLRWSQGEGVLRIDAATSR